jgi:hypothetical protein
LQKLRTFWATMTIEDPEEGEPIFGSLGCL